MNKDPKKAFIWDETYKNYRNLNKDELNKCLNLNCYLKCPLDLLGRTEIIRINYDDSIFDILQKIYQLYSNKNVLENMDKMFWFNGFSLIGYELYSLNITK